VHGPGICLLGSSSFLLELLLALVPLAPGCVQILSLRVGVHWAGVGLPLCPPSHASWPVRVVQPGESKTVVLVDIGGRRVVQGGNCLLSGPVEPSNGAAAAAQALKRGFGHVPEATAL